RITVVDLRGDPFAVESARRIAEGDAITPFTLDRPPLIRFHALRAGDERWVLVLTMHHIVGDGWSLNVLHRELLALYEGAALTPLRIQYKDFAAWQNEAGFEA